MGALMLPDSLTSLAFDSQLLVFGTNVIIKLRWSTRLTKKRNETDCVLLETVIQLAYGSWQVLALRLERHLKSVPNWENIFRTILLKRKYRVNESKEFLVQVNDSASY